MHIKKPYNFAFSLTELVVVIAIVSVLSVMGVSAYKTYRLKSQVSSLAPIGDSIAQRSLEYYSTHGVYPTAAQLGYTTASDGKTLTDPQSINPLISNLYISGSIIDGNSASNPMGYAVLTLNGASFPNGMATGTNPGFLAYSFGQTAGAETNPFVVGCETAFSIDSLQGAAGDYSYVTCPSGVPYISGTGSGGANLPQVCSGCSLSSVLAAATGSSGYLGAYAGGSSGVGYGNGTPASWNSCTNCPTNVDYTAGCTQQTCYNLGYWANASTSTLPTIVEFAQQNGYFPNTTELNNAVGNGWSAYSAVYALTRPTIGSGTCIYNYDVGNNNSGFTGVANINLSTPNVSVIGTNFRIWSVDTPQNAFGRFNLVNLIWYNGTSYNTSCIISGGGSLTYQVPQNCVQSGTPEADALVNTINSTAQIPH